MRDPQEVVRPIDSSRSGFLSRFFIGRETDIQRPAHFFEDFFPTVLMNADTRAEGTLAYALRRKKTSMIEKDPRPEALTAAHVFNYNTPGGGEPFFGFDIDPKQKIGLLGMLKINRYFLDLPIGSSMKSSLSFMVFQYTRDFIFGSFKAIDTAIRWPVIVASAVQLFFERAGWAMRGNNIPYLRWPIRFLGLVSSVVGVAAAGVTSVAKVLVEFVRAPFAVAGGVVGLIFGLGTALFSMGNASFSSTGKCILNGILDGIRPFAPSVADYLAFYADGVYAKSAPTPVPWGTIIGVALGIGLVIALSIVSFGAGAGVAALATFILKSLGVGGIASSVYLAPLVAFTGKALGAMGLAGKGLAALTVSMAGIGVIGACAKAGNVLWNGAKALVGDSIFLAKSAAQWFRNVMSDRREERQLVREIMGPDGGDKSLMIKLQPMQQVQVDRNPPIINAMPGLQVDNKREPQLATQRLQRSDSLGRKFKDAMNTASAASSALVAASTQAPVQPQQHSSATFQPQLSHSKSAGNLHESSSSGGVSSSTTASLQAEKRAINALHKSQSYSSLNSSKARFIERKMVVEEMAYLTSKKKQGGSDSVEGPDEGTSSKKTPPKP
ncbi:MAG: hypothetical protein ACHQAX_07135 [Gammaproteobacteria bacterium]